MSALLLVRPVFTALRSHKTAVTLLVLEIALTMAILGNLIFIIQGGLGRAHTATGASESQLGVIQSVTVMGAQSAGTVAGNLNVLRAVPNVKSAAYGGAPLWYAERDPLFLDPSRQHPIAQVYEFQGSQGFSRTLGLRIVQGHDFNDDEIPVMGKMDEHTVFPVLITLALANRLFAGGQALGKIVYDGNASARIIGIVDHLRAEITGRVDDDYAMVIQYRIGAQDMGGSFLINAPAQYLAEALKAAAAALQQANPGHVQVKALTMAEQRKKYFGSDIAAGRMLIAIILILLAVTALGVTGLAGFWVQQRTRQIGMRRALGATRGDILRYFQIENLLIVSGGILLGVVFAYALNLFLMHRFELPQLPATYLAAGAITLWVLGQLAVLGPALRAAAVSPVVATRSV